MVLPSAPSNTDISCLVSWAVGEDGGLLILREGDGAGPPVLGSGAGCVSVCGRQSWAPHPRRRGGRGDGAADTHTTQLLGLLGRVGNGLSLDTGARLGGEENEGF